MQVSDVAADAPVPSRQCSPKSRERVAAVVLALRLVGTGCVRAMELDIDPEWVSFATYVHSGSAISPAASLLPNTYFSQSHYLESASSDFIAVFSR
jgi:hypothetical protein